MSLDRKVLNQAIAEVRKRQQPLAIALTALLELRHDQPQKRKKRHLTKTALANISRAQNKRWRKWRLLNGGKAA